MGKEKILSASRIKTLEGCTWKYWCEYHNSYPESSNAGSARGTACHLVLEVLLNERHRKYIDKILKAGTIEVVPSICRLVKKSLTRDGYLNDENYKRCDEWILCGLNLDFLGEDIKGEVKEPEKHFVLESENPKFKIRGYIDKPIEFKDGVKMVDYKTTKEIFPAKEIEYNVQALAYLLAAKELWPDLEKFSLEFQFLKFPETPIVEITATDDELEGFKYYLEHVYTIINNFSEEDAHKNFSKNHPWPKDDEGFKGPLACGYGKYPGHIKPKTGLPYWVCDHKWSYDYWVLLDENGKVLKSVKDEKELEGLEGVVEKRHYDGCPVHQPDWNLREQDIAKGKPVADVGDDVGKTKIVDNFDF